MRPSVLEGAVAAAAAAILTAGIYSAYAVPKRKATPSITVAGIEMFTPEAIKEHGVTCGRLSCPLASSRPDRASCYHYEALVSYIENFLAKPHKDVGRSGPVCPFVPRALQKRTIQVGLVGDVKSMGDMMALVRAVRDHFVRMHPTDGPLRLFKAVVLGFPTVSDAAAPELIDEVQRRLKPEFARLGLMIGEFHANNSTPGLHNEAFFPLRTPIPALAMRHMVPSDLVFLKHDEELLKAFLVSIPASASNAKCRAEAEGALHALSSVYELT